MTAPRLAPAVSVKRRLTRVILTACLGVLVFTCAGLFVFEVRSYRVETARNLGTAANIIAENSAAALIFDDQKLAGEILGGLRAEPGITAAALFDKEGKLYATFPKDETRFTPILHGDGTVLTWFEIKVQQPIFQGRARVGTIYLEGSLVGTYQRLRAYGWVILGVGACSVVLALLLSNFLQRRITVPLASLAETARTVTSEKDYSVRAVKVDADELGEMTDAFNSMLDQIQTSSVALQTGEERFRTLADNIGQLAWMAEPNGDITWYNKRWFDFTGSTLEEMKGWGWQKVHHPEHVQRVSEKFKKTVEDGRDWEDVFPIRGRDGKYRWFLSRAFPIRNNGSIVRWFGTNTDITEEREAQERLQSHAHRAEVLSQVATQLFLSDSPRAILKTILPRIASTLGADFFVLYLSTDELETNLLLDSAGGFTSEQEAAGLHRTFGESLCASCAQSETSLIVQEFQHTTSESATPARHLGVRAFACYPLRAGGHLLGTLAFATRSRDCFEETELHFIHTLSDLIAASVERTRLLNQVREARDVAEKASAAKDDFLASLSHELRTPLNPILLVASDAATNESLEPRTREEFAMIAKNVTVEARLIDDLLDLTKISRGKLDLQLQVLDVHDVLRDALALVNPDLAEKRISLRTDFERGYHQFNGDSVRMQQVFWNILKNAIKFSPEGSTITVESLAAPHERKIAVRITDQGIGLTPDEILRVFEPFAQGDHVTERDSHRFGGLGLGLAISRTLVQLHGGTLQAASTGRGQGATFAVELPLLVAPGATKNPLPSHRLSAPPKPSVRVLLVEDHPPTQTTICALLRRRGHQVDAAGSLKEARALARQKPFDLLISDIGLPDGTGYTLMAELRTQLGIAGIALSGYGAANDVRKGQEAGFLAYLTKPVNIQVLDATLASVLSISTSVSTESSAKSSN